MDAKDIAIRPALASDISACVQILRSWIEATPWMPMLHSVSAMEEFWGTKRTISDFWVADAGAQVVGFCVRDGEKVFALYVSEDARSHGVGTHLLNRAKSDRLLLSLNAFQANERAIAFYEREGFRIAGETLGDNEERLPDHHLVWSARGKT